MHEAPGATAKRRPHAWLFPVVAVAAAIFVVNVSFFWVLANFQPTGPSVFAPSFGPERVLHGTIGCRSVPAEVCYLVSIESSYWDLPLSSLRFTVAHQSSFPDPNAVPVSLGPGATVSALNSTSSVAGVWDALNGSWVTGSNRVVPSDRDVSFVLDSGLMSNATLSGAWFSVVLTGPYAAESVAFDLH